MGVEAVVGEENVAKGGKIKALMWRYVDGLKFCGFFFQKGGNGLEEWGMHARSGFLILILILMRQGRLIGWLYACWG